MSYEIVFYALFVCGHYCLQIDFIEVCIFYSICCKTSFSSFCDFCVFCLFCVEFDENFVNFILYIIIVYIGLKYYAILLSLYQNNLCRQVLRHKNLIIDSPYKTCLQRGLKFNKFLS